MKILITTVFFPPQNAIASQRPYVWAREWAKAGHDVTVLTVRKDREKGDLSERPFDGFRVLETSAGSVVEFLRRRRTETGVTSAPPKTRGFRMTIKNWLRKRGLLSSVRLPDVFDFWIPEANRVLRTDLSHENFDVIVSTFGPHASLRVGYHARKMWPHAKWIVDFRDLWTQNHVYPGFWPFTFLERALEKFYLKQANAITTVSDGLALDLLRTTESYGLQRPIEVFTNGFDPEEMPKSETVDIAKTSMTLVYTGSLHPQQRNPEPLLRALSDLTVTERKNLKVIFAGPRENFLEQRIQDLGLADVVQQVGSYGRVASLKLQREASVLLFFETQHEKARDGVLTGKLFEYLATGRPIWAIGVDGMSTVGSLVEVNRCGEAFGSDVAKLKMALRTLLEKGPAPSRVTTNPEDVLHRFDRRAVAAKMLTKMEQWTSAESDRKQSRPSPST